MKKLLSLLLVLCMTLSLGAAFAEDDNTFTVACVRWTEVWGTDFTETALLKEIGEKPASPSNGSPTGTVPGATRNP